MEILVTKLKNGEILVGKSESNIELGLTTIKDSLQVILTNEGISFINFNNQLGNNPDIVVSLNDVLYQYKAKQEIVDFYEQQFSDIILPQNAEVDVSSIIQ